MVIFGNKIDKRFNIYFGYADRLRSVFLTLHLQFGFFPDVHTC